MARGAHSSPQRTLHGKRKKSTNKTLARIKANNEVIKNVLQNL